MIFFRRSFAVMCALGLGAAMAATTARAENIDLEPDAVESITGIAWDEETREVLVTDEAGTIAAVDTGTGDSRELAFTGESVSVQALSLFDGMLYIGDIGDEEKNRDSVTVFRVNPDGSSTSFWAWDYFYADGPHQAEAMALSGNGRVHVVTGGDDPGIYRGGLADSRTGVNRLTRTADAPSGVSDAVFLGDGATLMLRTDTGVVLLDGSTWETQSSTTYVDGAADEAITVFGQDRMLVGGATQLRDEPLPMGTATVTPTPPPSSQDIAGTASPVPSDATGEGDAPKVSRRGTLFALLGAAVVAVVAGLVVFVARD